MENQELRNQPTIGSRLLIVGVEATAYPDHCRCTYRSMIWKANRLWIILPLQMLYAAKRR